MKLGRVIELLISQKTPDRDPDDGCERQGILITFLVLNIQVSTFEDR